MHTVILLILVIGIYLKEIVNRKTMKITKLKITRFGVDKLFDTSAQLASYIECPLSLVDRMIKGETGLKLPHGWSFEEKVYTKI